MKRRKRRPRGSATPGERAVPPFAKFLIRLAITAAVLWLLLRIVPLSEIAGVLRATRPEYVAIAFLMPILARFAAAARMKAIADAQGLPLSRAVILKTLFAMSFYALFLPGAIAGGATTWLKYVQEGAKSGPAFAAIVVNRLTDALTVIFGGVCFWIADRQLGRAAVAPFFIVAAGALYGVYAFLLGRTHYFSAGVEWSARVCRFRGAWLHRKLAALGEHLSRMRHLPRSSIVVVLAAGIVQDLLGATAFWLLAHALGLDLGFFTVAWMRAATYTLGLLPISIAGLGVREGALVFLSAPYGVPAAAAIAWSSLVFAGALFAGLAGGALEAHALWRRKR